MLGTTLKKTSIKVLTFERKQHAKNGFNYADRPKNPTTMDLNKEHSPQDVSSKIINFTGEKSKP
jgi:hypothetical protein